jgi:hypothetical protein
MTHISPTGGRMPVDVHVIEHPDARVPVDTSREAP